MAAAAAATSATGRKPLSHDVLQRALGAARCDDGPAVKEMIAEFPDLVHAADDAGKLAVFPHVITSLGHYLSRVAGLAPGQPMAYLVAPPIEFTVALDAALKAADVVAAQIDPPPSATNFASAFLTGDQPSCEAAAVAFAAAVVDVARRPLLPRAY